MWNLLDILSILSDDGQCDPALLFWLAEELLDSQTIAGCRKIFDFLESRRERITANHFKQKQLIILRTCNELLRRLSRAEDTAFCGRVFIFMFQSFPLGDKSSVNLRGEYHVENVTTYETKTTRDDDSKMAVDEPEEHSKQIESKPSAKPADVKKGDKEMPLSTDELYPLFWSLQEYFSQPKKLFEASSLSSFKGSLMATMNVFQTVHNDSKRSLKRKRESSEEDESSNAFNPKYLTSKDLFDLEVISTFLSTEQKLRKTTDQRPVIPTTYPGASSDHHGLPYFTIRSSARQAYRNPASHGQHKQSCYV